VLGGAALASLGSLAAGAGEHEHTDASISGYAFAPDPLTIGAGGTVTWTNQDRANHDVTGSNGPAGFASPEIEQGETWSFTFAEPGTYAYICVLHPEMRGTVIVDVAVVPATSTTVAMPTEAPNATEAPAATAPTTSAPGVAVQPRSPGDGTGDIAEEAAPAITRASAPRDLRLAVDPMLLLGALLSAVVVAGMLLRASGPS
jgi:plastocyanin